MRSLCCLKLFDSKGNNSRNNHHRSNSKIPFRTECDEDLQQSPISDINIKHSFSSGLPRNHRDNSKILVQQRNSGNSGLVLIRL